jgi:hypothetical protein
MDSAKGQRVEVEVDTGIADVDSKLRALVAVANEAQARKRARRTARNRTVKRVAATSPSLVTRSPQHFAGLLLHQFPRAETAQGRSWN